MNLLSGTVVGAAGICASPALYHAFVTGGVSIETALTRYLIALGICWVAMSLVAMLIGEPPDPRVAPAPGPDVERPTGVAPEA
jgi:hypothetical protein